MGKIDIGEEVLEINNLVNTDEKPFVLFIKLYERCKELDKLSFLSQLTIDLKIKPEMKDIALPFKALNLLLELYQYSENNDYNYYLTLCRLGDLYSKCGHPLKALDNITNAEIFFRGTNDYDMIFLCVINKALVHYRIHNIIETELFYLESINILKEQKKSLKITSEKKYLHNSLLIYSNLSNLYEETKQYDLAYKYHLKCKGLLADIADINLFLETELNIIRCKINLGQLVSIQETLDGFLNMNNIQKRPIYYNLLNTFYLLEKKKKNYNKALSYLQKACNFYITNYTSINVDYHKLVDTGLTLSYSKGNREDVIFFSTELMRINKIQNEESEKISKKSFLQFEDLKNLEIEKRLTEDITYMLGHDLKSPLRIVKNVAEILKAKPENKKELISLISTNSNYALELMNQTLNYVNVVTNLDVFSKVSLSNVVNTVIQKLDTEIVNKSIKIRHSKLPIIKGNYTFLKQLFENLISNAIKFGTNNNNIEISAETTELFHIIKIKDEACGIPKDELKTIFKLFKISTLNEDKNSTGVGLAICKKIVELHNGEIYAEPNEPKGSVFVIKLSIS